MSTFTIRRGKSWRPHAPDWWLRAALFATVTLGLTVVLALVDFVIDDPLNTEATCGDRPFACGMITGLGVTIFAVALAFVFWSVLRKDRLVAIYMRKFARGSSERSVARPDLFELIIGDLRTGATRPQLIVGGIASGKSTALDGLSEAVADAGAIPIRVDLADARTELDFGSLAQAAFLREVRSALIRDDEVFGVWRRLLSEGRLVLLADGLGQALPERDDRRRAIREAIESASAENFGLVLAARPEDIPLGLNVATFELTPLDLDSAVDFVIGGTDAERDVVREFVVAAEATDTPSYLRYLRELAGAGLLKATDIYGATRFRLRIALLRMYFDAVADGTLKRDAALLSSSRSRVVEALSEAALRALREQRSEIELSDDLSPDPLRTAEDAARLLLVDAHGRNVVFSDLILQGYLAAAALSDADDTVGASLRLLQEGGRDAAVAVVIAAGLTAQREPKQAADSAAGLVEHAATHEDGRRYPLATAAVDIAGMLPDESRGRIARLLQDLVEAHPYSTSDPPRERARFAGRLASLPEEPACVALWTLSRDATSYVVRLTAARQLAWLGEAAFATLREGLEAGVQHAEERFGILPCRPSAHGPASLDSRRRFSIAVQCWMLPSLHGTVEASRESSRHLIERWIELCWDRADPGVEASLAQGLKFAAANPGDGSPLGEFLGWSRRLLERARFWYSEINLIHAAALCGARSPGCRDEAGEVVTACLRHPHPLVARTAALSVRALEGDARPWIWDDEVEVSRRPDSGPKDSLVALGWRALDDEALTLIADVTVFLNLIEGDSRVWGDRPQRLARACGNALPECLGDTVEQRSRLQVRGTAALLGSPCPDTCGQQLCPYPARSEPTFRGELNEAFCREQARQHASDQTLASFWADMEHRAQS